ncbi:isoamyl acetate-hydrolyzing esterase 1 homolog isoform X2 [Stegostoma tigrinum]|uniref:isoamyl acetate-hydrolyzing esterase 1 homolog isoform X2 n=1 Tax=Stegostoma tigrinum TaxID=3053191 RepID=UPI0028702D64|nr:isoamyl acetate-hydrolyzing esterase 1 homolog isoform X2 [Stegostoma tigrinum]
MSGRSCLWPKVILFGDSITQQSFDKGGWGAAIANRLVRKCDVVNRGLSGYNTKWALTVLPKIITQPANQETIAAVAVFFGANDSALKGSKLNRYNSVTNQYAGVCVKVAKECGTDVLDLCTLMQMKNQDFSSYLSDGLHLSEKGNKFLETHLWALLEKKTEKLPMILPHWSNIDHLNPEGSLLV